MCDNSVNKAVHGLAAILLVRLVGQSPTNVKNEICPYRCFAFYTRTARLRAELEFSIGIVSDLSGNVAERQIGHCLLRSKLYGSVGLHERLG